MVFSIAICITGLLLILYFSEKLVEAAVGTSLNVGLSAFLISLIFIGFDPENLFLGAVASYEQSAGIALGTIFGSAMVAIALALGITASIVPMKFDRTPLRILLVPVFAVLLLGALSLDGLLSRIDGLILLAAYAGSVWFLIRMDKKGLHIKSSGEALEALEEVHEWSFLKSVGWLALSITAIILGSELMIEGSKTIIGTLNLSGTVFGMSFLALVVSIEELARELPAALKGRVDITYGNVAGSVLAFFLFNAGFIALVRPVPIGEEVLYFYLPFSVGTLLFVTLLMTGKSIPRWAGILLIIAYFIFFGWGYLI